MRKKKYPHLTSVALSEKTFSLIKDISDKFNFKKPFFGSVTVSLPVANINVVGDVIALNKTIEDLKYMREFKIHK